MVLKVVNRREGFQSTLPCEGATYPAGTDFSLTQRFNPRSRARERRIARYGTVISPPFQSTLPCEGATKLGASTGDGYGFQSTLPCEGATRHP